MAPMPDKNYYEILEISRSATEEQIAENFRLMLYKYHPDHNQGNEEWAATQTIQLVEAQKMLLRPEERRKYDFKLMYKPREKGVLGGFSFLKKKEAVEAEKLFDQGVNHFNQGRRVPAAECFKKALQLCPDFADAAYNFSLLATWLGNPHLGYDIIARLIKSGSKDEELVKLANAITKTYLNV
jgi:DnaJ-class molecular chaperone